MFVHKTFFSVLAYTNNSTKYGISNNFGLRRN